jgi:hypothetical protein
MPNVPGTGRFVVYDGKVYRITDMRLTQGPTTDGREKWGVVINTKKPVDVLAGPASLIRKLEDLKRHRGEVQHDHQVYAERQRGELNGLDMAIRVLKGEL